MAGRHQPLLRRHGRGDGADTQQDQKKITNRTRAAVHFMAVRFRAVPHSHSMSVVCFGEAVS